MLANLVFWLLIGAALKPATPLLPASLLLVSLMAHVVLGVRRVGELKRSLPSESQRAQASRRPGPLLPCALAPPPVLARPVAPLASFGGRMWGSLHT